MAHRELRRKGRLLPGRLQAHGQAVCNLAAATRALVLGGITPPRFPGMESQRRPSLLPAPHPCNPYIAKRLIAKAALAQTCATAHRLLWHRRQPPTRSRRLRCWVCT